MGRSLLLNGNPFMVKGISYLPTPIGDDPNTAPYGDYFTSDHNGIYNRDLPLIRQMGANTVRLYDWDPSQDHVAFLDAAYNNGTNPVYVIAGYHIDPGLDIDPASPANVRNLLKAGFHEMVASHKKHPAILLWAIGDSLNAGYAERMPDLMSLVNEMAEDANAEDPNHPVVMPLDDQDLLATIGAYDAAMTSLDIWGASVYRGNKAADQKIARLGGMPNRLSTLKDPGLQKEFPEFKDVLENIKYANPDWRPLIPEWPEISMTYLGTAIHEAITGKKTPEAAMNGIVEPVRKIMEKAGYYSWKK